MRHSAILLTAIAALPILILIGLPTYGEETIQDESQAIIEVTDAYPDEEEFLHPIIDFSVNSFDSNLRPTNWTFDTDFLIMDPGFGSVDFSGVDGDRELASGLRFTFGWESNSKFGLRTQLTSIGAKGSSDSISYQGENTANGQTLHGFDIRGVSPLSDSSLILELNTVAWDLDFYKRLQRGRTDIILGVGLRNALFQTEIPNTTPKTRYTTAIKNTVSAGGLSLFSEGRHTLIVKKQSKLAFVGGGRVSFLSGEVESKANYSFIEGESDMTITEGSLGLEWSRNLGRTVITLRAQYEYQLWNSEATSDLALSGGALRAGLSW